MAHEGRLRELPLVMRVVRHWSRWAREVVDAPSLEVLKGNYFSNLAIFESLTKKKRKGCYSPKKTNRLNTTATAAKQQRGEPGEEPGRTLTPKCLLKPAGELSALAHFLTSNPRCQRKLIQTKSNRGGWHNGNREGDEGGRQEEESSRRETNIRTVERCSSPLTIFVAFLWTHSNRSMSFLYSGPLSWMQYSRAALNPFIPQSVLILGISQTQVQDLALGLVEVHEVCMGLLLKPVKVPLDGIPSL
ncbi:hypothetical protein QYF61_003468 [Mycteria americana]|uniref:Uncharacterized protein n=1 Tax=Mycteria americana TaxID=33587 RepID=A0AAN7S2G1_MYCAM|nr:hypothetical protein QYF61_003468 [Mycteria americana]